MNLGAFMNPEFPIFSTTLCYLERDDAYLMLHRIKKQDDYNHDKWIGVGGKFERFESPEDCLLREVKEETGLTLKRFRARGLLTFIWGNMTEFIHLYTADEWTGEMVQGDACREGVLEWVPKDKAAELPIWEGDKIFFRLLNEERPYFSLKAPPCFGHWPRSSPLQTKGCSPLIIPKQMGSIQKIQVAALEDFLCCADFESLTRRTVRASLCSICCATAAG